MAGEESTLPYERLTRLDESFLAFETLNAVMHVALMGTFDAGPLRNASGGLDIDRIARWIDSRLPHVPRYRQRLHQMPVLGDYVWIDDERFDLRYHLRHSSLPAPGDDRQLKERCAEILERGLDRSRPLWELWFVEGLSGGRFALIAKVHHCMVDGVGGVDLLATLLSLTPDGEPRTRHREPWKARERPRNRELLRAEVERRTQALIDAGRGIGRALQAPAESGRAIASRLSAAVGLAAKSLGRHAPLPFNQPIGPHRRVDWLALDLDRVKQTGTRMGATVNDVILATVAGSIRRFLVGRGQRNTLRDLRVAVPVNVRSAQERGRLGNRASAWIVPVPLDEPDLRRCLHRIRKVTADLKRTHSASAVELLTEAAEWTTGNVARAGVRLLASAQPYDLIVTNVPGPPIPLYLLGAKLLDAYPHLPLFEGQGLGIALFSYENRLYVGFTADWDQVADLGELTRAFAQCFDELAEAAFLGIARASHAWTRRPTRPAAEAAPAVAAGSQRRPATARLASPIS